jgi:hypothetical protein
MKEKIKKDKEKNSFTLVSSHFAITKVTQHEIHFMSNLGAKTFHAMLGCFVFFSCHVGVLCIFFMPCLPNFVDDFIMPLVTQ